MQQLNILDDIEENEVIEESVLENAEWKEYKLGELIKINELSINKNFSHKVIEYLDTSSVTQNRFEPRQILDLNTSPSRAKRIVRDNDTLISTVRPNLKHYGFIKDAKPNTIASTGFAVLSPKNIEPEFLFYFISQNEVTSYLSAVADTTTTTFPAFNTDILENLIIKLPELNEQQQIAKILSSLDDKIELNQKINKTLEEMAQAIFKHWFIDFEFPNEEGKPYKSSGGEMVDSEIGEIPRGWYIGILDELANVKGGKRLPLGSNLQKSPTSHPYIRVRDMGNKYIPDSNLEYVPEDVFPKISNYIVSKGNLILSIVGTVGLVSIVSNNLDNANLTENCVKIVTIDKEKTSTNYLYYYLISDSGQLQIKSKTVGSTQPKLPIYNIKDLRLLIPDKVIQNKFEVITSFLGNKTELNELNINSLTKIRDSLLPKLMSGEIRTNSSPNPFSPAFKGSKEGEQESES